MEIAAGQFKAQCLSLMDHVHDTHEAVLITKRGRPVARMISVEESKPLPLYGRASDVLACSEDVITPVETPA
jgi:prevent-host-death family protein